MSTILGGTVLVFLFPVQGPFLDIFNDSDKIFSAFCQGVLAFDREHRGVNALCYQPLSFKFSEPKREDLWCDIQQASFEL